MGAADEWSSGRPGRDRGGAGSTDDTAELAAEVLDVLADVVVVIDRSGVVTGWNAAAEQLLRWSRAEAIGQTIDVTVPSASGTPAAAVAYETARAGGRWSGDLILLPRTGAARRVSTTFSPVLIGSEVVAVVMSGQDVTERRPQERRAAELMDRLELALEAGQLGTWRWDAATDSVVWDERLERLFGLEPGTFDGTFDMWVSLLHPDDREQVLAEVERAIADRRTYHVEHRVAWPDSSVHWLEGRGNVTLDDRGAVTGTIGCAADITGAKRHEQEVERVAAEVTASADRERRERERIEFLVSLTDASLDAASHREFMDAAASAAVPRLGDWCSIHFIPEPGAVVERTVAHADPERAAWADALLAHHPYDPTGRTGVPAVIRTGTLEFVDRVDQMLLDEVLTDAQGDPEMAAAILEMGPLTSIITAPLVTKQGVVGAIRFVSAESGRLYDEDDVTLAEAAGGRIAGALENLWLTDQHREMSITLQTALLPPAIAAVPGVDVAVRYWPASAANEVGGDFYDLFPLTDDHWALVIGDVCGTGPDAAALTGIVRHTLRAASRHGQDHATVLDWVNQAVAQSGRDLFCTACYATLTAGDGGEFRFVCAAAGHPLPIVVRANGDAWALGTHGTLLGVFDDIDVRTESTTLAPGDVVVLYTDGISDLPPPHDLSPDQVIDLVRAAAMEGDADGIADDIRLLLSSSLPVEDRHDDIALLVVRIVG